MGPRPRKVCGMSIGASILNKRTRVRQGGAGDLLLREGHTPSTQVSQNLLAMGGNLGKHAGPLAEAGRVRAEKSASL